MRVKRVALLGATGSIGRQAIEVVERNPELELCALASGSADLAPLAAEHGVEHTQVGGDLTELLEACEPDVVLNAVVGFAGVGATLWALERGVTLALANKESLVAAGELALAAKERGGGLLLPGRLRALGALSMPRGTSRGLRRLARPDRLGRAVSRAYARRARNRRRRRRARAPDLEHGPEDHRRLGHARQQGTRADRGTLSLRHSLREHRGRRASELDRAFARPIS